MQRHLPLAGAINFRDLGGYESAGGGRVKWRRLFRSGHLANLSDADVAGLAALGVASVCDFRTTEEQRRAPSRLPPVSLNLLHLDIWPRSGLTPTEVVRGYVDGTRTLDDIKTAQRDMYRSMVEDFSDRYAAMFKLVLGSRGAPLLIHCRGGRDRTGFGAALILFALGVPEAVIVEDYMRTNDTPGANDFIARMAEKYAGTAPGRGRADLEAAFNGVFPVRAENLKAAFDTIAARHGSMDAYLRDVIGIGAAERAQLRDWFLEKP